MSARSPSTHTFRPAASSMTTMPNARAAECPRRQKVIDEYPTVTKRKNEEVY